MRTCAFAAWQGKILPGTTVNAPLHMVDWYPTLIKLAGGSLDQPLPIDGRDLWPTITAQAGSPHEEIVINTTPQHGAIRAGDWKLVLNGQQGVGDGEKTPAAGELPVATVELFDLATDPGEKHNCADEQPSIVARLRQRYEAIAKEALPPKARPKGRDFVTPRVWGELSTSEASR